MSDPGKTESDYHRNSVFSQVITHIRSVIPFLGPSLILAVSLSGRAYSDLMNSGANFGFTLLWVIGVALIFKYAIVDGITRYTLATGEHIFAGLRKIPGPENWEIAFILFIYLMEMVGYGGLTLSCSLFLGFLLPVTIPRWVIAVSLVLIVIALLYYRSYKLLERIVLIVVISMVVGMGYIISAIHLPWMYASGPWSDPIIAPDNLPMIVTLLITVGSGLSLLFSSIWLQEKIQTSAGKEYYLATRSAMRTGNILAFLMVGLFSLVLVIIGFVSLKGETVFDGLITVLRPVPYGLETIILVSIITLFGTILTGVDGRARAISRVLHEVFPEKTDDLVLYRVLLFVLSTVMLLVISVGNPVEMAQWVLAIANVMFAITGFMILYLDLRLPSYARGHPVWIGIMVVGSGMYLLIALLKEEFFLKGGIPLIEGIVVVLFLLYIFMRTDAFRNAINRRLQASDKIWIIVFCTAISIYGTYRGVSTSGLIINFRDFGVMIAGLIAGPFVGVSVGLISGLYRYSLGGWSALPCFLGTVAAGIISGYASIRWRYKLTYLRVIILAICVESVHLLVIFPISSVLSGYSVSDILELLRLTYLPMVVTNTAGIVLYLYLIRDHDFSGIDGSDDEELDQIAETRNLLRKAARPFCGVIAIMIIIGGAWSLSPVILPDHQPMIHIHYAGTRGDHSYTDSAYLGFLQSHSLHPFKYKDYTSFILNTTDAMYRTMNSPYPALIITHGFQYGPYSKNWSALLPESHILAIDQYGPARDNIRYEEISAYGSSYQAGVLAANISKTGKISVIAGTPSWLLDGFIAGFTDGADATRPDIQVTTRYVANGTEGFYDEKRSGLIAEELIGEGNDIIFGVAAYSNIGMIHTAKNHPGVYVIGVDSDQSYLDPEVVIASVVKQVDRVVSDGIDAELNGTFTPGTYVRGLSDNYSSLVLNPRYNSYESLVSRCTSKAIAAEKKYLQERRLGGE